MCRISLTLRAAPFAVSLPVFLLLCLPLGQGERPMLSALATKSASAEEGPEAPKPAGPVWSGAFEPVERDPEGWDWLRLSSNEWIKGELILMRDFDLEFDSDEFGVVQIDWEDVSELLTSRAFTFVLEDMRTTHAGTIAIRGEVVQIRTLRGQRIELERGRILAITPANVSELRLWRARASVGVNARSGNTDSTQLTGRLRLGREGSRTRLGIEYTGSYGSLDNLKNTNNHRGNSVLDYFLTRDLFLTPTAFEVFSDEFQNVSYRLTPSAGAGYYLFRKPRFEWQARLSAGYQHTRNDSAVAGDSKISNNAALTLSTDVDTELTSDIDLLLLYQLQLVVPETEQTNHHGEATLEIELTSVIDLDLSFIWDRIEEPERESGGDRPATDDFRLVVGFALEY